MNRAPTRTRSANRESPATIQIINRAGVERRRRLGIAAGAATGDFRRELHHKLVGEYSLGHVGVALTATSISTGCPPMHRSGRARRQHELGKTVAELATERFGRDLEVVAGDHGRGTPAAGALPWPAAVALQ